MELENKDILERSVSEKMCSSGSNGVGEICSPGTADTCGDRGVAGAEGAVNQRISVIWRGYVSVFLWVMGGICFRLPWWGKGNERFGKRVQV